MIDRDEVCVEQFDELLVEDSHLPCPPVISCGHARREEEREGGRE